MRVPAIGVAGLASLLVFAFAPCGTLEGQTCFRGRPLPTCKGFWIVETGFAPEMRQGVLASMELGGMRNVSRNTALGGAMLIGFASQEPEDAYLVGFKPRFRRWLGGSVSLDLSPGAYYVTNGKTFGFAASGSLGYGDWVALDAQLLMGTWPRGFRGEERKGATRFYIGIKTRSYLGGIGLLGGLLGTLFWKLTSND